jgi:predicted transposase YdaD
LGILDSAKAEGKEEGKAEGLKEGIVKGKEEGLKEGKKEKAIEMAKISLDEGLDIKLISKITGLSIAEIEELRKES